MISYKQLTQIVEKIQRLVHEDPIFPLSTETYQIIRAYNRMARLFPVPARKLRKCQMRRRYKRLRRERSRYAQ